MIDAVYNITNRPDKVALTLDMIKAATLKMHSSDFYAKDIYETGYSFPSADFYQSLDYINLIPNWRAIKYLKRVEDATDVIGKHFSVISVDEILDSYGNNREDICYVAGRVIEIKSSVEFSLGLLGAYVFPIVTPTAAYSSWVAEQFPYAIIHEAARVILKTVGKTEESKSQGELMAEQLSLLKASSIGDVGY